MQLLAETFRKKGIYARAAAFNTDFRNYQTDIQIRKQKIPIQRFNFFLKAIREYNIFHFFWGISLFDFWIFTGIDLPLLKRLNKKVVVHFRGTDLIDIKYYNYLIAKARGEDTKEPAKSRPDQIARLNQWRKYADCLLVSTPDLMRIVPEAILVPQVVDVSSIKQFCKQTQNEVFRLGHAPTRRNTKGTDFIKDAVTNLNKQGYKIELDLIENELPSKVLSRFSECDAGIDQLLSGWYGKVSVELMAMGKPVLCNIDQRYDTVVQDLPIVNVSTATLEDELKHLIVNPGILKINSKRSIEFSDRYHDVTKIAEDLLLLYDRL